MSKPKIKLPTRLGFVDYHEVDYIKDTLRKIIPGIKVKEIGYSADSHEYVAICYYKKQDAAYKKLKAEIEAELEEADIFWESTR